MTLAAAVSAQLAPNSAPWFATPRPTLYVLLATVLGIAVYAWRQAHTHPRWSSVDATAWVAVLCGSAVLAGSAAAPVPFGAVLYCAALIMLATRDPSDAMVLGACATAALAPVTRVMVHGGVGSASLALVTGIGMMAFTAVTAQTRLLLRALSERDAALTRTSVTTRRVSSATAREAEKTEKGDTFYTFERTYGSFARSFTLPEGVVGEKIDADLKDGVLTVTLPKKPEAQPKQINVKAK